MFTLKDVDVVYKKHIDLLFWLILCFILIVTVLPFVFLTGFVGSLYATNGGFLHDISLLGFSTDGCHNQLTRYWVFETYVCKNDTYSWWGLAISVFGLSFRRLALRKDRKLFEERIKNIHPKNVERLVSLTVDKETHTIHQEDLESIPDVGFLLYKGLIKKSGDYYSINHTTYEYLRSKKFE